PGRGVAQSRRGVSLRRKRLAEHGGAVRGSVLREPATGYCADGRTGVADRERFRRHTHRTAPAPDWVEDDVRPGPAGADTADGLRKLEPLAFPGHRYLVYRKPDVDAG